MLMTSRGRSEATCGFPKARDLVHQGVRQQTGPFLDRQVPRRVNGSHGYPEPRHVCLRGETPTGEMDHDESAYGNGGSGCPGGGCSRLNAQSEQDTNREMMVRDEDKTRVIAGASIPPEERQSLDRPWACPNCGRGHAPALEETIECPCGTTLRLVLSPLPISDLSRLFSGE